MTMLTDGLKDLEYEDVSQLDVAELLLRSVKGQEKKPAEPATADQT